MDDRTKTKAQLIQELEVLRTEVAQLKQQAGVAADRVQEINNQEINNQEINSQEINKYKQTIETLHQREANLRLAQRLAHVGSWEWNCVTNTITWSEEM